MAAVSVESVDSARANRVAARRANARAGLGARQARASHLSRDRERVWRLNPAQDDFVACRERFSFYVGGRGAGKTWAGALKAVLAAQEQPGSLGLVGAPTFPMLRDFAQRTFLELCPPGLIRAFHRTEQCVEFTNGSEVLFRAAHEEDRYRGLNLAWYWLDEAPYCGYRAWQILKATLRQAGYATRAWATGTPCGVDGFARDFETERKPRHALFRASTRANAHNLPETFLDDLGYAGDLADQEVEGLFVSFRGLVYRFLRDVHVRDVPGGMSFARVVGGVDWGYTNPTAAVVFGLDGDRRAWQVAEWYERRASFHDRVLPEVVRLTREHRVEAWYCDPEDPGHVADLAAAVRAAGLPCRVVGAKKGPGSVVEGIQTVTRQLAVRADGLPGLLVAPGCVHTIAEYGAYRYATLPEGEEEKRDPREEPVKQGDHALDATRYALHEELSGTARTEAYLAEMQRRLGEIQSGGARREG